MSEDIWKTTLKQERKDGKVYYHLVKKNLVTGEEISIKEKRITDENLERDDKDDEKF